MTQTLSADLRETQAFDARSHPLASFGLDMLARGASRLRPDRPALSEAGPGADAGEICYLEFNRMAEAFGARLLACGLSPGARVVVVGVGRIGAMAAVVGCLGVGIEPVLAPAYWPAKKLAELAGNCAATAIAGPTSFGDLDGEALLFEAAAIAHEIRFVATFGPGASDGAIDLSPRALASAAAPAAAGRTGESARPRVGLAIAGSEPARATFLAQNAIVAQALDIVSALRTDAARPIVSLLSPASSAGLVAGPVAALLSGAPLVFFAPFHAEGFLALLGRYGPVHLLAPAAILPDLESAGVLKKNVLASLTLSERADAGPSRDDLNIGCPYLRIRSNADGRLSLGDQADASALERGADKLHHSGSDGAVTMGRI